jgi:hypothetical protein
VINDSTPRSIPYQGSLESTIEFLMQDFDYLFNAEYVSKDEKAWKRKISELILTGKANDEKQALELAELELEGKNHRKERTLNQVLLEIKEIVSELIITRGSLSV